MSYYDLTCELIKIIDDMIALLEIQDYYNAMKLNYKLVNTLGKLIEPKGGLNTGDRNAFAQAAQEFIEAQEHEDYIGMYDVCALKFRPLCSAVIMEARRQGIWKELTDFYSCNYAACDADMKKMLRDMHAEDDSDIPSGYQLEETQVGSFALKIVPDKETDKRYSLDGAYNPYSEAKAFVDAHCTGGAAQCVMLGLGMGYNAAAIDVREDIVQAWIYEHDAFVIKAALHYMDLSKVLANGKVKIIYDPQLKNFSGRLASLNGAELLIHYPSLKNIRNRQLRDKMEDFFLHYNSVRSQERSLRGNFIMNTADTKPSNAGVMAAESLMPVFEGSNVLFIAGGPSLDDNIAWLSDMCSEYAVTQYDKCGVTCRNLDEVYDGEKYIIVCVGTVLRRLISEGIIPDYVVMTDAQPNMVNQTAGVDTSKLSLIYLSTLYYKVPGMWQGNKYMALQSGFGMAERMAEEDGRQLFETGGSVAAFALDMCLRFKSSQIVCMGLDLAYTDGLRHAGDNVKESFEDCRTVDAVGGGAVPTAKNLDNYRLWIEQRLKRRSAAEKGIRLINISRGAVIHGMENVQPQKFV